MTVPTENILRNDSSTAEIVAVLNIVNNRTNENSKSIDEIIKKRGEYQLSFSEELHDMKDEIIREFKAIRETDKKELKDFKAEFYEFVGEYRVDKAKESNAPSKLLDIAFKDILIDAFKLIIVAGVVYLVTSR